MAVTRGPGGGGVGAVILPGYYKHDPRQFCRKQKENEIKRIPWVFINYSLPTKKLQIPGNLKS